LNIGLLLQRKGVKAKCRLKNGVVVVRAEARVVRAVVEATRAEVLVAPAEARVARVVVAPRAVVMELVGDEVVKTPARGWQSSLKKLPTL
jgi:hypothetical protein